MGDVIAFNGQTASAARLEFCEAAAKTLPPLREVAEVMKWHAWSAMELQDAPEAAVAAWQAVAAGVRAIEVLAEMSGDWWAVAPGQTPDDAMFRLALESIADRFAPAFVERMRQGDVQVDGGA